MDPDGGLRVFVDHQLVIRIWEDVLRVLVGLHLHISRGAKEVG